MISFITSQLYVYYMDMDVIGIILQRLIRGMITQFHHQTAFDKYYS